MILLSFAAGFAWTVAYRLLGLFRRFLGRGKTVCMLEDFFLAIIFAVSTYMFMYETCGGLVRGYNYLALILGIVFGTAVLGKLRTVCIVRAAERQEKRENSSAKQEALRKSKGR